MSVAMSPAPSSVAAPPALAIDLRAAGKSFARRGVTLRALLPVDLAVPRGSFLTIVGPSGCGKSTILNMVAGLMPPSEGCVLYNGAPVDGPNRRVGYMTQKDTLLPWRSVEDNIGIALELRCRSTPGRERRDRVARIMEVVGLSGFGRHYPNELSGGMRKRAALARMLIYEPETLLLDEPFGALDAQLKLVMQQELLRLTRARQMTVLFVTHDLGEALTLADRIILFSAR
ncbi:MAG: ABC transporter ATP-binding protein, partial [Acidisphaera sp.]|nr:ABC transporter ATP-binding protein [Acidisphaera sp.]